MCSIYISYHTGKLSFVIVDQILVISYVCGALETSKKFWVEKVEIFGKIFEGRPHPQIWVFQSQI